MRIEPFSNADNIVSIKRLGKRYEPTPLWMRFLVRSQIKHPIVALDNVNFSLNAGEICAVVGPNGAGKTTLFRVLMGLTTPTTGTALVGGYDAHHESTEVRRMVGWMPAEDRSLFMRLTCRENLYFHGRLQGMTRRVIDCRISEVLEQVGLAGREHTSVFGLSAGMRARLQLARALLARPRLLILDEPTGAVDPVGAHQLLNLIMQLVADDGIAALISSHRLEEIEALQSSVILLDRGRVRFCGDLDSMRAAWDRPKIEITFSMPSAANRAVESLYAQGVVERHSDVVVSCLPDRDVSVGDILTALDGSRIEVTRIRELRLPLRDLLVMIYTMTDFPPASHIPALEEA